jgi:hypothetical protein
MKIALASIGFNICYCFNTPYTISSITINIIYPIQYVTETFRTDNILNPEYHRFFRVVPAAQVS